MPEEILTLLFLYKSLSLFSSKITFTFKWFRDEVSKEDSMPEETLTLLFSHIDPLYELHASFLKVVLLSLSFPLPSQLPLLLPHIFLSLPSPQPLPLALLSSLPLLLPHSHCHCQCQLPLRIPSNFSQFRKPQWTIVIEIIFFVSTSKTSVAPSYHFCLVGLNLPRILSNTWLHK